MPGITMDQIDRLGLEQVIRDVISNAGAIPSPNVVIGLPDLLKEAQNAAPVGMIVGFSGAIAAGFLPADGAAVSRDTYAGLFAYGGTVAPYGPGDGATTFNVPNIPAIAAGIVYAVKT